ncbi:MAG: amidohydrolase [Bacteroidales bacterium]
MKDLLISYIQTELFWEDRQANRDMLQKKIESLGGNSHIIVLPEMFDTGFSMKPAGVKEQKAGQTLRWMQELASRLEVVICGSIMVAEAGKYFNRFHWTEPGGRVLTYDKKHLFRMGEEPVHYTGGTERTIIHYRGWNILPLICYDLRFPVWSGNCRTAEGFCYDLLIYVANWPAPRREVWKTLLEARALENQAFCIGVNRVGKDNNGLAYTGDSMVLNAKAEKLMRSAPNIEHEATVAINKDELNSFREKFPVSMDWDAYKLE